MHFKKKKLYIYSASRFNFARSHFDNKCLACSYSSFLSFYLQMTVSGESEHLSLASRIVWLAKIIMQWQRHSGKWHYCECSMGPLIHTCIQDVSYADVGVPVTKHPLDSQTRDFSGNFMSFRKCLRSLKVKIIIFLLFKIRKIDW